jgi:carboxyl-terminal processing protease
MKTFYKKTSAVFLSIFLFALIFGVGFFVGNSEQFLGRGVNAEEPLDLSAFWKTLSILDDKFVDTDGEEVNEEEKVYGAIEGLVKSYGDPYTSFLTPEVNEQFEETISGVFVGIGAEIGLRDDFLTIIAPLKDSPAERSGLKAGDKIISIDGESALDFSLEDGIKKIRGEQGTTVTLTVLREGSRDPLNIDIVRDTIVIPTLDSEIIDGVFVVSLYNFSANANIEFRQALRDFINSKSNKLVLDLRGNPGGFLETSIDIASWFLPAGKVIAIEDFGEGKEQKVFRSKGYNIFNENLEMIILIDGGSASASEIVAGALKAHGVAVLLGKNTFGKGSVQELIDITNDTSLKVTIAKWLTPNGESISDGGLTPDIEVEYEESENSIGYDSQLKEAIRILNN